MFEKNLFEFQEINQQHSLPGKNNQKLSQSSCVLRFTSFIDSEYIKTVSSQKISSYKELIQTKFNSI